MNRYAGIKYNDIVDGEGVCVSFWTQGCPHRCPECHNPQTWDFNGGFEVPSDIKERLIEAIGANDVQRGFSVLGGEPLCDENLRLVNDIILSIREVYPQIKVYLWSGYTIEELIVRRRSNATLESILSNIDVLVEGRYIKEKRDLTLKWRGSSNQKILYRGKDF